MTVIIKDNKVIFDEFLKCNDTKNSQMIDTGFYIKWIPLLLCWPPDQFLGISEYGDWVVEEKSGLRILDKPYSFWRVKVLLEKQISEVRNAINTKLKCSKLDFDTSFPYVDLLEQVIKNDSDYWVDLALVWFDDIPNESKMHLTKALETIKDKKNLSQKTRHKAIKELAKLERREYSGVIRMNFDGYHNLMNNTKWKEIRLAMYNYPSIIQWRIKNIDSGYVSTWDAEWFYHFAEGGYDTIEWLEIKVANEIMKTDIVDILREIHVPGEILKDSIKIYGYIKDGFIDYI